MKKALALILAMIMVLSLAACAKDTNPTEAPKPTDAATDAPTNGGDTDNTDGTDAPKAEASQNLKIVYCVTSLSTDSGARLEQLARLFEKQVNEAGGINGREVEMVAIDGGSDQQAYINALLKALEEDNVSAVIGTFYSQYALACADYVNEAKVPVFNLATNFEMREKSDYYFTNRCVDTAFSNVMAQIAIDNGCKNPVAVVYNTSNGKNDSQFMKNYLEANGASMADIVEFDNTSTTDYTPIVQKAINTPNSDGILLHATVNTDGQSIIALLKQYDYKYPVISNSNLFSDAFMNNCGAENCIGLMGFSEYPTVEVRPQVKEFTDMILSSDIYTYTDPSWVDASFWDDCNLILEAAKIAGDNDKDSVYAGLSQVADYEGVMTSYTFHEDGSYANYIYLATIVEDKDSEIGASIKVTEPLKVEH